MMRLIVLLSFMISGSIARAITIGSNSAVSRNNFFIFPAMDPDNQILGFAMMDNGFALADNTTTCTFSSLFPVRKQFFLNGGTVILNNDIYLDNMSSFTSVGDIQALDPSIPRKIVLTALIDTLGYTGLDSVTFKNIELLLEGNIVLESSIRFEGHCVVNGNWKSVDISGNSQFIVAPNSSLTLENIILINIDEGDLVCEDDTGRFILNEVRVVQTSNATVIFDTGSMEIKGQVSFSGTSTFIYDSKQTSTIAADSEWLFTDGMYFKFSKNAISGAQPLSFVDNTSVLRFDNTSFAVGQTGLILTNGKVRFDRNVSFQFASTNTQTGVVFGNGQQGHDFALEFGPAAIVNSTQGHFTYNNFSPNGILSVSKDAKLVRSVNSRMFVAQNLSLANFTVSLASLTVPPITMSTGKTLSFNDVRIILPTAEFDLTSQQFGVGAQLLSGNGNCFLNKGVMPLGLVVSSTGNTISGLGIYGSPITFSNAASAATWSVSGQLNAPLTLNNGTLTIATGMYIGTSGSLIGPGKIILNSQTMHMPNNPSTWSTPLFWQGPERLELNNMVTLATTWTLSGGVCTVDGRGNVLDLTSGHMVVDSNTRLILKDIILNNVSGTNIRCVDNTASIMLDNVRWVQDADFTFTQGSMQFRNKTTMQGYATFFYQTTQTSTILDYATLKLDPGFTFQYDPPVDTGSAGQLECIDRASQLILNGALLTATGIGLSLTKGTLYVRVSSSMSSQVSIDQYGNTINYGISFGDDTDPANDLSIIVYSQVELQLLSGLLHYKNLNPTSLSLQNNISAIHVFSGAVLNLYENIYPNPGRLIFEDNSYLRRVSTADVIGAIEPRGVLIR